MTHVKIEENFSKPIDTVQLNNDGIGYVDRYDFSRANLSNENRIAAISTIASICYQSPKAAGSISLYNRLANESAGLPSSSFEFVPVLISTENIISIFNIAYGKTVHEYEELKIIKFGENIYAKDVNKEYLLTNLRALMLDVGERADEFLNTEEECETIAKYHRVFKAKMPIWLSKQFNRHRVSLQELSRRYVSGSKHEFEFYISPKMKKITSSNYVDDYGKYPTTEEFIEMSVDMYNQAISNGVKPEEARSILPQSMYTTIWSAWQPSQLESYLKLRCDKHTQKEHRDLALAMKALALEEKT